MFSQVKLGQSSRQGQGLSSTPAASLLSGSFPLSGRLSQHQQSKTPVGELPALRQVIPSEAGAERLAMTWLKLCTSSKTPVGELPALRQVSPNEAGAERWAMTWLKLYTSSKPPVGELPALRQVIPSKAWAERLAGAGRKLYTSKMKAYSKSSR